MSPFVDGKIQDDGHQVGDSLNLLLIILITGKPFGSSVIHSLLFLLQGMEAVCVILLHAPSSTNHLDNQEFTNP